MAKLEGPIEKWFVAGMLRYGYMTYKGDASSEKQTGWVDRFFFGMGGRTIFVEFKRDDAPKKRRGEKLQDYMRDQLRRRGYETYLVRGWAEAYKVFALITGEVYDHRGLRGTAQAKVADDLARKPAKRRRRHGAGRNAGRRARIR